MTGMGRRRRRSGPLPAAQQQLDKRSSDTRAVLEDLLAQSPVCGWRCCLGPRFHLDMQKRDPTPANASSLPPAGGRDPVAQGGRRAWHSNQCGERTVLSPATAEIPRPRITPGTPGCTEVTVQGLAMQVAFSNHRPPPPAPVRSSGAAFGLSCWACRRQARVHRRRHSSRSPCRTC